MSITLQEDKLLRQRDKVLLAELFKRAPKRKNRTLFRNEAVAKRLKDIDSPEGFKKFESFLRRKGLFQLNVENHVQDGVDGPKTKYTIARATSTEMWPMGTTYWVRDNAIVAARLLMCGVDQSERNTGKEMLLSALRVMSSSAQLNRFRAVIRKQSSLYSSEANNWPMIFTAIKDNLDASRHESWTHKQDAWQMVGVFLIRAIQRREISIKEIGPSGRNFLGLVAPFLAAVRFWEVENSGSWEEIPAVRTSTISWEYALINAISEIVRTSEFSFIKQDFDRYKKFLPKGSQTSSLNKCLSWMRKNAEQKLRKVIPFESPSYKKSDDRFRKADSALLYPLQLDTLEALYPGKRKRVFESEKQITAQVLSLFDKQTGGFFRYNDDSYQRLGFFRFLTVKKLTAFYGAPSGDASTHFRGRDKIVPRGRKAAWTHFTWQFSAWAGRMYLRTRSKYYEDLHRKMFINGLRMITGDGEVSIDQAANLDLRVIKIPAFRMPECYLTEKNSKGQQLIFPTPHTPLNWAVAEMRDAFFVRGLVLELQSI